jgi:hypothetical protein
MALSADRMTQRKDVFSKAYPVKATTTIYAGSLVAVDGNGYALPAADATGLKVVGVAKAKADNASGSDGDINVVVEIGVFKFAATAITQAMVGKVMYVVDDQTFDDSKGTYGVKAGRLVEYVSSTVGWIQITEPLGLGAVAAIAVVTAVADADATYGQAEADLINDIKAKYNAAVATINELVTIVNTYLA